jgi:hypothetical protein
MCAICIQDLKNEAELDCCTHTFCFECIDKWTKLTNLCPCCRKKVKKIKHLEGTVDVETVYNDDYDSYGSYYSSDLVEFEGICFRCNQFVD